MKKLISILLVGLITTASTGIKEVQASGIPTVDIASLLQGLADTFMKINQFKEQIQGAKERLDEMKESAEEYKDMVEGHYDWEQILNDPTLNKHLALEDWKTIYDGVSDLEGLREEFGLKSDDSEVQARIDRELQAFQAQNDFYDMSVQRSENLKDLLDQFSSAKNPAAKADLANSIQFENAQIKNDAKMMETMTELMKQKRNLESKHAALEYKRKMDNEGLEIDYSLASKGYENE